MLEPSNNAQLPEIPSKRYFTIGEVSDLCDVKPHVLRYWEQEFPQLKPVKRRGNRRYYQRQDVLVIRNIRSLLYEQGYTIGGARLQLTDAKPEKDVVVLPVATAAVTTLDIGLNDGGNMLQVVLKDMIKELEQVATLLAR
jgi:DNA-binding transcriptional MerR regulator